MVGATCVHLLVREPNDARHDVSGCSCKCSVGCVEICGCTPPGNGRYRELGVGIAIAGSQEVTVQIFGGGGGKRAT